GDRDEPRTDLCRFLGRKLCLHGCRRGLEIAQRALDGGLRRGAAMLLHLRAGLLRVGLGDDLSDEGVCRPAFTGPRDGTRARARFFQHGDGAVLPYREDGCRDQEWCVGDRVPLVVAERGLVSHFLLPPAFVSNPRSAYGSALNVERDSRMPSLES